MCFCSRVPTSPVSKLASTSVFTGCGHCEECRAVYKSSWGFRLQAEIEHLVQRREPYKVCFFTLTYNDDNLPRLPREAFRPDYLLQVDKEPLGSPLYREYFRYLSIPCFSRDDVQSFVHSVREWLWREYDYKDVSYFIASEFGDNTRRPHYHGLLAVPPSVDTDRLHAFICQAWTWKGFVYPRYPQGGYDSSGYKHLPFVVQSPEASARYCAKYVCKDLAYNEFLSREGLSDLVLDLKSRAFRRCSCFHVQKRSLGACILDGLSSRSKLELLTLGKSFAGDSEFHKIPIYIRNKILFDNKYQYELMSPRFEGSKHFKKSLGSIALGEDFPVRRLVRREASAFFKENIAEIYRLKVSAYSDFFRDIGCVENYRGRGFPSSVVDLGVRCIDYLTRDLGLDFDRVASYYLLYDGVPRERRVYCSSENEPFLYLARYSDVDIESFTTQGFGSFIDRVVDAIDLSIKCYFYNPLYRSDFARLVDKVSDFFGHLE